MTLDTTQQVAAPVATELQYSTPGYGQATDLTTVRTARAIARAPRSSMHKQVSMPEEVQAVNFPGRTTTTSTPTSYEWDPLSLRSQRGQCHSAVEPRVTGRTKLARRKRGSYSHHINQTTVTLTRHRWPPHPPGTSSASHCADCQTALRTRSGSPGRHRA